MPPHSCNDVDLNSVRNIAYRRSYRAKTLRITVRPEGEVVVTVPHLCRMDQAREFLISKAGWVQKKCHEMHEQRRAWRMAEQDPVDLEKAQDDLFDRLAAFSSRYDLPYRRAAFRCQKTKWGSCSGKNTINLNINIAFLPRHLQDYILLHELAHIKIKNHSRAFWSLLDRLCDGRAKTLAKELRSYPMRIKR